MHNSLLPGIASRVRVECVRSCQPLRTCKTALARARTCPATRYKLSGWWWHTCIL